MHQRTTVPFWLVVVGAILISAGFCNAQEANVEAPVAALIPNCETCTADCLPSCGEIHVFAQNAFVCHILPSTQLSFTGGSNPTFEGLMSPTPFPGRTEPGWVGSTTITFASTQLINNVPTLVCDTINVDIAENVLVGTCSIDAATGIVSLAGVNSQPIIDPESRIETSATDDLGFPIDTTTVPPDTAGCSLGGYTSVDGIFRYHTFTVPVGIATVLDDAPFVAVTLAECRGGQQLRLAGGTRGQFAVGAVIEVFMATGGIPDLNARFPTLAVSEADAIPGFGVWDMRESNLPGPCPSHVLVRIQGQNSPNTQNLIPTFLR